MVSTQNASAGAGGALVRAIKRQWSRWLIGFGLSLAATGLGLLAPWLLGEAIDALTGVPTIFGWSPAQFAVAILAVGAIDVVVGFGARFAVLEAARRVEFDLRNELFAHLQTLDTPFFDRFRTGDLIARLTSDLGVVRQVVGPFAFNTVNTLLTFALTLAAMFAISPGISLWVALVVPGIVVLFELTRDRLHRRFQDGQVQLATLTSDAQENIASQRVLQTYLQTEGEVQRFASSSHAYAQRQTAQVRLAGVVAPAAALMFGLVSVLLLVVAGRAVIEGSLTVGEFVQLTVYLGLLTGPALNLGWMATTLQQGRASLGRIGAIAAARPALTSGTRMIGQEQRGEITFESVGILLEDRALVHDARFSVAAGSLCAIVGPTGSGKSLLLSTVPRLRDPSRGRVLLDGVDIREFRTDSLRRHVALTSPETGLLSGTVRDNVAYAVAVEPDVEQRVAAALETASLTGELDLDTQVGEEGSLLSGGQRQRVALARALACQPRVLLLDDGVSAVDAETEAAILERLLRLPSRPTILFVSHRLRGAVLADQIVVMDRGLVVESGTHAELMLRGGVYTRLWRAQELTEEFEDAV